MGAREDKTFLIVTIAVFVIAIGSIVLMVRPIVPGLPPTPPMLTGQVFAVGDPIHSGYAPPWDLSSEELFYDVTEPDYTGLTAEDEITISVSIDRPGAFIYKRILYYNEKNSDWVSLGDSAWTKDSHELEIEFTLDELSEDNYLLAYTCIYDDDKPDKWDCGCKSASDTSCRAYTIQSFKGPELTAVNTSNTSDKCVTNADCRDIGFTKYDAAKRYCKQTTGECVECKATSHCPAGKECTNNVCTLVTGTGGCTSDNDCSGSTPKCHIPLGECYECLTNGDCTGTDYCDEGTCEVNTTPSAPDAYAVTDSKVLFNQRAMVDCNYAQSRPSTTLAVSGMIYDADNSVIYTNDHAGMARFAMNKLQTVTPTIKDFFRNSGSSGCTYNVTAQTVSNCLAYGGDRSGCVAPRVLKPVFAGEGEVMGWTHSLSHRDSILSFSDADGSFDLHTEYMFPFTSNPAFTKDRPQDGVVNYAGGIPGKSGKLMMLFKTGTKRYGIFAPGLTHSYLLSDHRLYDLTNEYHPVDLGLFTQYPLFNKAMKGLCPNNRCSTFSFQASGVADKEKHVIVKEGSQYKLYDITDPTAVEEVDSFSCSSAFCYEGPVFGIMFNNKVTATLDGDTVYAHITGGEEHDAAIRKSDYSGLNRLKANKCYDRARRACYYGQIWKHTIGSNGWTKVMNVPGVLAQIEDDTLWLFGTADSKGIYDRTQLHSVPDVYGTTNYNLNVYPGYRILAYDLTDGSELMHVEVDRHEGKYPNTWNTAPFALMEKAGKKYIYFYFKGRTGSYNDERQKLVGYEIIPCSGASCDTGYSPGSGGGGGGTPPGGGGGGSSCSDPCTGSGSQCGPGTRDCYAFGIPGPQPQCAYERECVDGCWTYDVCSEGESCSSGQCTGNQAS